MASTPSLEEKFQAAVKVIQSLPQDGTFQPSNDMKLTFYGLYKQATVGACQTPRPSVINYVNRAKWDAWDKCRTMSRDVAMSTYIDEIRKILETMPQTSEVLEFTRMIGPFYEFVDDREEQIHTLSVLKKPSSHGHSHRTKANNVESLTNGIDKDDHHPHAANHKNGPVHNFTTSGNGPIPSSSPSSSSSSSSITSSDIEEFYEDPSDRLPIGQGLLHDEIVSDRDDQDQLLISNENQPGHVYGGQNGNNLPTQRSQRGNHHYNQSSRHSSVVHPNASSLARYSPSSINSGRTASGGDGRHPHNNYSQETQHAILTALSKLQRDVNNILERLNRLETSTQFLQQRSRLTSQSNSLSRWFPLAGLRRRAIAFIVLWPFFVFALIRLFLRARIIIRFRKTRL